MKTSVWYSLGRSGRCIYVWGTINGTRFVEWIKNGDVRLLHWEVNVYLFGSPIPGTGRNVLILDHHSLELRVVNTTTRWDDGELNSGLVDLHRTRRGPVTTE